MRNNGFTLVELLVVATIMGLLATVGISGFQSITKSGRDALRKADLEQIRSALEIYKSENGSYPVDSTCDAPALAPDYINTFPVDPKSPTYRYCYRMLTAVTYQLCAHLENGSTTDEFCGGGSRCTGNCNYQAANP